MVLPELEGHRETVKHHLGPWNSLPSPEEALSSHPPTPSPFWVPPLPLTQCLSQSKCPGDCARCRSRGPESQPDQGHGDGQLSLQNPLRVAEVFCFVFKICLFIFGCTGSSLLHMGIL